MIETTISQNRPLHRQSWFLAVAGLGAVVLALVMVYASLYFPARMRLNAAIAEAKANGEPLQFRELNPGPGSNPSKDMGEFLALRNGLEVWESNDPIQAKVSTLHHRKCVEQGVEFTPAEKAQLANYAEKNANILVRMAELAKRGDCWFEYDYETTAILAVLMPHISEVIPDARRAATADVLMAIDSGDDAVFRTSLARYFDLPECLRNEPFLVSQLTRGSWIDRGVSLIESRSQQSPLAPDLAIAVAGRLAEIEKAVRLEPTVLKERAALHTTICNLQDPDNKVFVAYSISESKSGVISPNNSSWWESVFYATPEERQIARWNSLVMRPQLLNQRAIALELMKQQSQIIDVPGPQAANELASLAQMPFDREDEMPLLPILLNDLVLCRERVMATRQRLQSASLLLKLLPAAESEVAGADEVFSLIEGTIADAPAGYFSGKPLEYEIEGSTISLYDINPADGKHVGKFTLTLVSHDATEADTGNETSSEEGAP